MIQSEGRGDVGEMWTTKRRSRNRTGFRAATALAHIKTQSLENKRS
jgi:hypothetical protein